jgi:hypothetical protein
MVGIAASDVARVAPMAEIDVAMTTRGLSCKPATIPLFSENKVILRELMETVTKAMAIPRGSSGAKGPIKIRLVRETENILSRVPSSIPATIVETQIGVYVRKSNGCLSDFLNDTDGMLFQ